LSINGISANLARVDIAALASATNTLVLDALARRVSSTVRIGAQLTGQGIFIVYANVILTGILCALYSIITGCSGGTSSLDIGPNVRLLRLILLGGEECNSLIEGSGTSRKTKDDDSVDGASQVEITRGLGRVEGNSVRTSTV